MPSLTTDLVATDVLVTLSDRGAVMFKGWLEDKAADPVRFYVDPQFLEWLEISNSDVLHQIPGTANLNEERRSVIWVEREARITKCRRGYALSFAQHEGEMAPDVSGLDPARSPRWG